MAQLVPEGVAPIVKSIINVLEGQKVRIDGVVLRTPPGQAREETSEAHAWLEKAIQCLLDVV